MGNGVRRARERRRWTQQRLAELANVSPSYLNKIEQGKRRPSGIMQERLAEALGIERDELFGERT